MLSVEDWAEIRRLHKAEGMPIKVIARTMGCSKNTVKKALSAAGPPSYSRAPSGSVVDAVEPLIREYLQGWPSMPATVIAERIGWDHSIRVLRDRVTELRPAYLPPDPASRTTYEPGELAQFDFWFPDIRLPVGAGQHRTATALPVLTMVSGYSRWRGAVLVPTRWEQDLYAGWWHVLNGLGAVPKALVWDGEGAVGRWRARQPELTQACQAFRGVLGAKVDHLQAGRPGGQGHGRTVPRPPRALVPARAHVHLPGRLQHPADRVDHADEQPAHAGARVPTRGPGRGRQGRDDGRCRRWRR